MLYEQIKYWKQPQMGWVRDSRTWAPERGIKGDNAHKMTCFHGTSAWEPRQPPSPSCSSSNASLLSFHCSAPLAYESPQVFVPPWIASITPLPSSNGVSEMREGKRHIYLALESQQSSCLPSFIRMPFAEKEARSRKQHEPEIILQRGWPHCPFYLFLSQFLFPSAAADGWASLLHLCITVLYLYP